jgi:hypothetical protein
VAIDDDPVPPVFGGRGFDRRSSTRRWESSWERRCSADEAFAVLREVSQTGNIKLREVATRLITATTGQPPRTEPPLQEPPTE